MLSQDDYNLLDYLVKKEGIVSVIAALCESCFDNSDKLLASDQDKETKFLAGNWYRMGEMLYDIYELGDLRYDEASITRRQRTTDMGNSNKGGNLLQGA